MMCPARCGAQPARRWRSPMKKPLLYSLSTISDPRYFSLAFIRGSVSRKTEDCETEEARSEAATHTFSILAFQYLTPLRSVHAKCATLDFQSSLKLTGHSAFQLFSFSAFTSSSSAPQRLCASFSSSSHFASIRDGMKSFSNRRWADRNVWFNVPRGTRECCNTHGWPKVQKVRE